MKECREEGCGDAAALPNMLLKPRTETARAIQIKDLTEEGCGDAAALPNMLMYPGAEAARMSNSSKGPNWPHVKSSDQL